MYQPPPDPRPDHECQHLARAARLDRLRALWRLYGYEIRLLDGWYPDARITIARVATDGHLDMNAQLHGHWKDSVADWIEALKAGKNVYDLPTRELNRGWGEDA